MSKITSGQRLPQLPETPKPATGESITEPKILFGRHRKAVSPDIGRTSDQLKAGRKQATDRLGQQGPLQPDSSIRDAPGIQPDADPSQPAPRAWQNARRPDRKQPPALAQTHTLERSHSPPASPGGEWVPAYPLADKGKAKSGTERLPTGTAIIAMRQEIFKIKLTADQKNLQGSFLRGDSRELQRAQQVLLPELKPAAESLTRQLCDCLKTRLDQLSDQPSLQDIDRVLAATYSDLVAGFRAVDYSERFRQVARSTGSALDSAALKHKSAPENRQKQQQIDNAAAALKKNIGKALLLRLFAPHITLLTSTKESSLASEIGQLNALLAQLLPPGTGSGAAPSFKVSQFVTLLQANINGAIGEKQKASLADYFPQLLEVAQQTDVSDVLDTLSRGDPVRLGASRQP